jgi:hypothetical protein
LRDALASVSCRERRFENIFGKRLRRTTDKTTSTGEDNVKRIDNYCLCGVKGNNDLEVILASVEFGILSSLATRPAWRQIRAMMK